MKRRTLIKTGVFSLPFMCLGFSFGEDFLYRKQVELLRTFAAERATNPFLYKLGGAYLAAFPDEASPRALTEKLTESVGGISMLLRNTGQVLIDQMTKDFESGHVTTVNGWILSRTEARLCALGIFSNTEFG